MQVVHYVAASDEDPFQQWLDALRDRAARVAVQRRIDRLVTGNFGDHKFCREGVWELRIDVGPGFLVYYARAGKEIVVLLCAGAKRSQAADIDRAVQNWQDYQRRIK